MLSLRFLKVCLLWSGLALFSAPALAQTVDEPDRVVFPDAADHWANTCIKGAGQGAKRFQLMSGYLDGSFRPDNTMTRAEFAAVIVKAFPNAPAIRSAPNFSDVSANFWGRQAIQTAFERGFLMGYPGNVFKPNQAISRAQAIVIIANTQTRPEWDAVIESDGSVLSRFYEDAIAIPNYAKGAIAHATRSSLVVNYPNVKRLRPNDDITRGEAAALLCRIDENGLDARHYVPADYVAAFGHRFNESGFPFASRPEPTALGSFDSTLDGLVLWEGIELDGSLFFIDNLANANLWKTDGTVRGTGLVRSLDPIADDSANNEASATFIGFDDEQIWLSSRTDSNIFNPSRTLWRSDGTREGTQKITGVSSALDDAIAQSERIQTGWYPMEALDSRLPLWVQNRTDSQLWITDGQSDERTELLTEFTATTTYDNGFPDQQMTATEDYLFFIATAEEREDYNLAWTDLWRTDGTPAGTVSLRSFHYLYPEDPLLPWQNQVYFMADLANGGRELWTSDGTAAGTVLLDTYIGDQGASARILGYTESAVYILANSSEGLGLWETKGTPESTRLVQQLATEQRNTGGTLYKGEGGRFFFSASVDPASIIESDYGLWVSDGTAAGTQFVTRDLWRSPLEGVVFNDQLFFSNQTTEFGEELWVSDGTAAGTRWLVDLTPGIELPDDYCVTPPGGEPLPCPPPPYQAKSTSPRGFMVQGDLLYFLATDNRLFRTDGTSQGMELVSLLDGDERNPSSNAIKLGEKILFMTERDRPRLWVISPDEAFGDGAFTRYVSPGMFAIDYPIEWYIKDEESDYVSIWNQPPSRSSTFPSGFVKTDIYIRPDSFEEVVRDARAEAAERESTSLTGLEDLIIDGQDAFRAFYEDGENGEGAMITLIRYSESQTAQIVSYYKSGESANLEDIQRMHQSFRVLE